MEENPPEKMELRHDPLSGYRTIFYITLAVGVFYLGLILFHTL